MGVRLAQKGIRFLDSASQNEQKTVLKSPRFVTIGANLPLKLKPNLPSPAYCVLCGYFTVYKQATSWQCDVIRLTCTTWACRVRHNNVVMGAVFTQHWTTVRQWRL